MPTEYTLIGLKLKRFPWLREKLGFDPVERRDILDVRLDDRPHPTMIEMDIYDDFMTIREEKDML